MTPSTELRSIAANMAAQAERGAAFTVADMRTLAEKLSRLATDAHRIEKTLDLIVDDAMEDEKLRQDARRHRATAGVVFLADYVGGTR